MVVKIHKLIVSAFLFAFFGISSAIAATSIPFTVNMSEAVNVTGTPRIAVDVGGVARYANYTSGTGSSALTFTYAMVAGDVDLDGVTLTSPIDLNGGTMKDLRGNDLSPLTYTLPNTSNVKVNYPSLGMDFIYDADGRYTLNGTVYNDLTSFLSAAGGTFTRASTATYFDSTGTLQTAASGTPRFDYNPTTLAAKGILIEETRTNSVKYSERLEQANWGKTYANVTADATTAPDGTMTADKVTADGSNNPHFVYIFNFLSSNTDYAISLFAKKDTANYIIAATTGSSYVNFQLDLATGNKTTTSSGGATLYNASVQSLPNGWYWVRFSFRQTSGLTQDLRIYVFNTTTSEASNASAFIWGAQVEQGAFPTSYIATPSTTAVTRAADSLTIPTSGWYASTSGTFFSEYFLGNTASNPRVVALNTGAAPMVINNPANPAQWRNWSGGSGPTATSPITPTLTTSIKTAAAWDDSGPVSTIGASGSAVITGTYTAGAYNGSSIYIGSETSGYYLDAPIKKLKFYPTRINNTQLQLLTQ